MRGGKAADRDHGGEMIDADHRMAEAGQDALAEGGGDFAAHQVMGEGRFGGGEQRQRKSKPRNSTVHDAFLPNAELSPAASA